MEKGCFVALCFLAIAGVVLTDDDPTFFILPAPAPAPAPVPAPAPAPAPAQNRNVKVTFRKRVVVYRHKGGNGK